MLVYWLLYFIPVTISFFSKRRSNILFFFVGFLLIFFIGFRFEVGGDWPSYIRHYNEMENISLLDAIKKGDPGHRFLNWIMYQWDMGVYGVNFIYAIIFVWGLIRFSKSQPYPWIAITVAIPYLVIVVAMGYSRQGVAIGLFLLAITYLDKGKFKTYTFLILFAALFHKTALLLLPLGIFLYGKGKIIRILMIIPIAYGAWDLLLAKEQNALWQTYVEAQMQSQGAMIRVVMNLFPSLLFFYYKKEWKRYFNDYNFWYWIALGSVLSVGLVSLSSTAVDRIALYFIPIQLVVFSRLAFLARKQLNPSLVKILIIIFYLLILLVWLVFASHAHNWLPYQNIMFQDLI